MPTPINLEDKLNESDMTWSPHTIVSSTAMTSRTSRPPANCVASPRRHRRPVPRSSWCATTSTKTGPDVMNAICGSRGSAAAVRPTDLDHCAEQLHGAGRVTTSDAHHAPSTSQHDHRTEDRHDQRHHPPLASTPPAHPRRRIRRAPRRRRHPLLPDHVHPPKGGQITKMYLDAAAATLAGAHPNPAEPASESGFRYTKELLGGDTAILEFETTIEDPINGVDITGLTQTARSLRSGSCFAQPADSRSSKST